MAEFGTLLTVLQSPITLMQPPVRMERVFYGEESLHIEYFRRVETPKIATSSTDVALGLDATPFILGGYHEYRSQPKVIESHFNLIAYTNDELVQPISAAFRHLGSSWRTSILSGGAPKAARLTFGYCSQGTNNVRPLAILLIYPPHSIKRGHWDDLHKAVRSTRVLLKEAHQQASDHDCPQVLIFDGMTLLRFDFCNTGMSIEATTHIQYDMVYDHLYLPPNPKLPPAVVSVRNTDPASYSGHGRSTVREVLYLAVLTGLRRVICCRLFTPMPIDYEGAQYLSAWFDWSAEIGLLRDGLLFPPSPECEVQLRLFPNRAPESFGGRHRQGHGFQWVFVVPGGQSYPVSINF